MFIIYYILNNRLDIIHCRTQEELEDTIKELRKQQANIRLIKDQYGEKVEIN